MKLSKQLKMTLRALLMKAGEVATDKGTLLWEGEAELEVGTEVYVETQNGDEIEVVPAPDGEYAESGDGGRIIVVADGKVSEIRDKEGNPEEEAPAEEPAPAEDPVEAEDEPQAEPADSNDEEEQESIEDRVARLEARLAEFTNGIEQILNGIVALEERLEAVEAKVASLEEPGADPAEQGEEFNETPKSRLSYLKK